MDVDPSVAPMEVCARGTPIGRWIWRVGDPSDEVGEAASAIVGGSGRRSSLMCSARENPDSHSSLRK